MGHHAVAFRQIGQRGGQCSGLTIRQHLDIRRINAVAFGHQFTADVEITRFHQQRNAAAPQLFHRVGHLFVRPVAH
ncbi:hypothetical protein SDC9_170393 [bioreactor metagenome]|uniref:Uncharacterized protein n=1 Tax=bioreactor metagenome TaxID=1076179 RepID=A0A645G7Z3_9ZZZZ